MSGQTPVPPEWVPCRIKKPHVAHSPNGQPCEGISYNDPRLRYAEDLAKRKLPCPSQ